MSLKIRSFTEIFNSLATWITSEKSARLSDFTVGSALRTLTEAISLQVEELYFNMKQNVEYAIETAIYSAFGFEQVEGQIASGYVKLTFTEPLATSIIIGTGTTVATSLSNSKVVYYKTTDDYVAEVGSTELIVEVGCTEIGEIGNCGVGEINVLISGSNAIESVTNITTFTSGRNTETKSEMKARFKDYLKSLGRATAESIVYGVKTVEGVAGVHIDDNYIGFVNVYCHDKEGNLPDELKDKIILTLEDYRAGGIEVKVLPVVKHPVNLSITLVVKDNTEMSSVIEAVNNLLTNFLNSYTVSKSFYASDLITVLMNNYKSIIVTMETEEINNIKVLSNELIVAGTVDIDYVYVSDWR